MKRLTRVYDCETPKRIAVTKGKSPQTWRENTAVGKALLRLAAYEDTGLEPEEVKVILERYHTFRAAISDETGQPMVSWTRAGEICRAEKDGRLKVLPYKIGDSVYRVAVRRKYLNRSMCTPYIKVVEITTENALKYKNEIGKTVFLTREEAEAALKKREEADVCEPESL